MRGSGFQFPAAPDSTVWPTETANFVAKLPEMTNNAKRNTKFRSSEQCMLQSSGLILLKARFRAAIGKG